MRIALGSDHAGSDLKRTVKVTLLEEHHDVVDVGTNGEDPVDYPDYAEAVAETLREHKAERGGQRTHFAADAVDEQIDGFGGVGMRAREQLTHVARDA